MKEIEKSVARFVELSKEFTIDGDEVYEGFETKIGNSPYIIPTTGSGTVYIGVQLQYGNVPSKVEQYEKALKEKVEKAKRFEEYLELQKTLTEYFNSVNKLNNEDTKV